MRKLYRFFAAALALLCLAEIADLAWLTGVRATITTTASKVVAAGNNATTQFNFSFVGVSASDLIVTITNSSGVSTVQTLNATYSVTFNAQPPNSVWSVGGYVTYPLTGSPLPLSSTITIQRQVPYTQTTPFQNQGQFLPTAVETALDLLTMQVQQLNTLFSGALVEPATDSQPLTPLPAAAARANLALCFDSTGYNPIACATPSSGVISSAMQPVVDAASLAAGRTAFGLGSMAVENINGGSCGGLSLQDDGAGFARVTQLTFADAVNKAVSCNYNQTYHIASGPIAYTLSKASTTYFNGFAFTINSAVGVTTVTPNASDNFAGVASGASVAIPQGSTCRLTTNAASSATWWMDCQPSQPALAAVASANALTLTLYATNIGFRDTTLANGDSFWATPAGGLSITIPSGATLGTSSSNVPFRIWIFAAYNAGAPILGVATCSANTFAAAAIYPCKAWETIRKSGTGITSGATSLGTLYTSAATSNDAVRIIGYAEYASGLLTAGTWASGPTTLQACLPPLTCPRPGEVIQKVQSATQSVSIAPTSTANLVQFSAFVNSGTLSNTSTVVTFKRASTSLVAQVVGFSGTGSVAAPTSAVILDAPGTTSSTAYSTSSSVGSPGTANSLVEEIMGTLEPANDNGIPLAMVG